MRFVAFEVIADEFQSLNLTRRQQHALSHIHAEESAVSPCAFALVVPKPEGLGPPIETVTWTWAGFQDLESEHQQALSLVTMAALWDIGAASSVRLLPDWGLSKGSGSPAERRLRIAVTPSGFRGRLTPDRNPQPDDLSAAQLSPRVAWAMLEVVRHAVTFAKEQPCGAPGESALPSGTKNEGTVPPADVQRDLRPSPSNSAPVQGLTSINEGGSAFTEAATPLQRGDDPRSLPALDRMHWEILQFLSRNAPGKFTRFDIAKSLGHNKDTVGSRVSDLAGWGLVRAERTGVVLLSAGESLWQEERQRRNPPATNLDKPDSDKLARGTDILPDDPEATGPKPE